MSHIPLYIAQHTEFSTLCWKPKLKCSVSTQILSLGLLSEEPLCSIHVFGIQEAGDKLEMSDFTSEKCGSL